MATHALRLELILRESCGSPEAYACSLIANGHRSDIRGKGQQRQGVAPTFARLPMLAVPSDPPNLCTSAPDVSHLGVVTRLLCVLDLLRLKKGLLLEFDLVT